MKKATRTSSRPNIFQRCLRRITRIARRQRTADSGVRQLSRKGTFERDEATPETIAKGIVSTEFGLSSQEEQRDRYWGVIVHNSPRRCLQPKLDYPSMSLREFCSKDVPLPCVIKFNEGYTSLCEADSIGTEDMMIVSEKKMTEVVTVRNPSAPEPNTHIIPLHTNLFQVIPPRHQCSDEGSIDSECCDAYRVVPEERFPLVVRSKGILTLVNGKTIPDKSLLFPQGVVHKQSKLKDISLPVIQAKTEGGALIETPMDCFRESVEPVPKGTQFPLSTIVTNLKLPLVCALEAADEEIFCCNVVLESVEEEHVLCGVMKATDGPIEDELRNGQWQVEVPVNRDLNIVIMETEQQTLIKDETDVSDFNSKETTPHSPPTNAVVQEALDEIDTHVIEFEHGCHSRETVEPLIPSTEAVTQETLAVINPHSDVNADIYEDTIQPHSPVAGLCTQEALAKTDTGVHVSEDSTSSKPNTPTKHTFTQEVLPNLYTDVFEETVQINSDSSDAYISGPENATEFHQEMMISMISNPAYVLQRHHGDGMESNHGRQNSLLRTRPLPSLPPASSTKSLQNQMSDDDEPGYLNCETHTRNKPKRWLSHKETSRSPSKHNQKYHRKRVSASFTEQVVGNVDSNIEYLKTLTSNDIVHLLEAMNLGKYAESFRAEHIDGVLMSQLDEPMLTELNVTSRLHRLRILNVVRGAESAWSILAKCEPSKELDDDCYSYVYVSQTLQ